MEGKKNIDIIYISLEILDFFKYSSDLIKIIQFLFEISRNTNKLIQSKALQIISNLCDYNLKIIKDKGYEIQLKIIEIIEKQSDIELLTNLNPINVSLSTLLELNINRVAIHNPKSITIYNNQDEIIVILKNIRKKTINILKKLYFLAKNDIEKKIDILKALSYDSLNKGLTFSNLII